jgi:carboxymethylenebutenolidase
MVTSHDSYGASTRWANMGEGTRAFVAVPKRGTAPYAAVILGHERYGLVQHTLDLAAKFASYGYVCVAPDMASHWHGDKSALNRGEARLSLSDDEVRFYYSISLDYLQRMPEVHDDRIAAMGVCQSGGYPLLLNSRRSDIAASIIFYGGTATPPDVIGRCAAPILAVFGERDHTIPVTEVEQFRGTLERLGKSYDLKLYAEMPHGWLNDTMPGRYRQPEAEAAWFHMMAFLERVFAGGYPSGRVRRRYEMDIGTEYDFTKNVRLE